MKRNIELFSICFNCLMAAYPLFLELKFSAAFSTAGRTEGLDVGCFTTDILPFQAEVQIFCFFFSKDHHIPQVISVVLSFKAVWSCILEEGQEYSQKYISEMRYWFSECLWKNSFAIMSVNNLQQKMDYQSTQAISVREIFTLDLHVLFIANIFSYTFP